MKPCLGKYEFSDFEYQYFPWPPHNVGNGNGKKKNAWLESRLSKFNSREMRKVSRLGAKKKRNIDM